METVMKLTANSQSNSLPAAKGVGVGGIGGGGGIGGNGGIGGGGGGCGGGGAVGAAMQAKGLPTAGDTSQSSQQTSPLMKPIIGAGKSSTSCTASPSISANDTDLFRRQSIRNDTEGVAAAAAAAAGTISDMNSSSNQTAELALKSQLKVNAAEFNPKTKFYLPKSIHSKYSYIGKLNGTKITTNDGFLHQNIISDSSNNNMASGGDTGGGDAPYLGGSFTKERFSALGAIIENMTARKESMSMQKQMNGTVSSAPSASASTGSVDVSALKKDAAGGGGVGDEVCAMEVGSPVAPSVEKKDESTNTPCIGGVDRKDHYAPIYSRKVFVGGLPPDIDEDEIHAVFRRFGSLVVDWPHKSESRSIYPPKGYAFLLFQDEPGVHQLINSCIIEDNKLYLCLSSQTIKDKAVQIRPWRLADADYIHDPNKTLDPRRTVFIGGVPRPLKAYELAMIMDRLYGGVCYAGIDIDAELKYPKGAGRVCFTNQRSYIAAISARFVQLQLGDIDKRVEVKPYVLEHQVCDECRGHRCGGRYAPFFCANVICLRYFCENCWAIVHSQQGREFHKPLVKEGPDRPRAVPFRWS